MRYSYYYYDGVTKHGDPTKVVKCTSHFAGQPVSAVAKCLPDNEYDQKLGEEIAKARCDVRVGKKRLDCAQRKLAEALQIKAELERYIEKCNQYVSDSKATLEAYEEKLKEYPVNH